MWGVAVAMPYHIFMENGNWKWYNYIYKFGLCEVKLMKRSRLSYDEWKCIISKDIFGKMVNSEWLNGYIGLIDIKEVSKIQTWKFNGEDVVVCDKGRKWLSILPQNDWYCITAMMDENGVIILWYIDMIASQGIDVDGVPYFDDLYLDLVVYTTLQVFGK